VTFTSQRLSVLEVFMAIRVGIDIACRAHHRAACASADGTLLWSNVRFQTRAEELENLWRRIPDDETDVTIVMEPTRNAWVPLAAWFRRHGAKVVLVPPEQSSDLRAYYNKHAKTDRLDAELLARLPSLHPEGIHHELGLGPAQPLRRTVKIRSSLVKRRSACMHRLDALLEILGPDWIVAVGSAMTITMLHLLSRWPDPHQVIRLGRSRLALWLRRQSRGKWGAEQAEAIIQAAQATIRLWGHDGMDFGALAADIAMEAQLALELTAQIDKLEERISVFYKQADPQQILMTVPGVGPVLAAQIIGRLGDVERFSTLSAVRSYSGLVPRHSSSGLAGAAGGLSKKGDACLREAVCIAADLARRCDPSLAHRYHRLMMENGKHHTSAVCSVGAVLITRIVTCIRKQQAYVIRDFNDQPITMQEGRSLVKQHYSIPEDVRKSRRTVNRNLTCQAQIKEVKERGSAAKAGVAKRSKARTTPQAACNG
jgi:transposase